MGFEGRFLLISVIMGLWMFRGSIYRYTNHYDGHIAQACAGFFPTADWRSLDSAPSPNPNPNFPHTWATAPGHIFGRVLKVDTALQM